MVKLHNFGLERLRPRLLRKGGLLHPGPLLCAVLASQLFVVVDRLAVTGSVTVIYSRSTKVGDDVEQGKGLAWLGVRETEHGTEG